MSVLSSERSLICTYVKGKITKAKITQSHPLSYFSKIPKANILLAYVCEKVQSPAGLRKKKRKKKAQELKLL